MAESQGPAPLGEPKMPADSSPGTNTASHGAGPRRVRHQPAPSPLPSDDQEEGALSQRRIRIFWSLVFPYLALLLIGLLLAIWLRGRLPVSFSELSFVNRAALLLLVAVPLLCWIAFHQGHRRQGSFLFSRPRDLVAVGPGIVARLHRLPAVLRILAVVMFVLALGRPQSHVTVSHEESVEGIDIVLALDVSLSMQARDLSNDLFGAKTRLDVAKEVIDDFIRKRQNDRIGLVIFGREAYSWCPPTLDYQALRSLLAEVQLGVVDGRATAIGDALGTSINRLRRSKATSKVIILLTDGDNNSGTLTPNQAANFAAAFKIKIFTILVGRDLGQTSRLWGRRQAAVNPQLLEELAALTGGTPYLATDQAGLRERFQRILDTLTKDVRIRTEHRPSEHWHIFFLAALLLLLMELGLRLAVLRRFP